MYAFQVNGKRVTAARDETLLRFLRDSLRLLSVKDGCAEGACGTCMVLLDGKATRACVLTTRKAAGRCVVTVEGFSPRERAVYAYAFAKAGAVQCGYCMPGMLICAKALLDRTPAPSPEAIREAIKGNLCRCTGYVKIEAAIALAARMLREGAPVPEETPPGRVGERLPRVDARAKALGEALYAGDLYLDGMLHGGAVRSEHPRARVLSVDVRGALAVPGVAAVITAADLPGAHKIGHLKKDQYVLVGAGEVTTYLGDAVALIAAESREALEAAKAAVRVEYEVLDGVFSIAQAQAPDAPPVHPAGNLLSHQHLKRGDADARIREAAHVVTRRYTTPPTEHAFLEPETAVAVPEEGGLTLYTGDQGIYQTRRECAEATGLPEDRVRVVAMAVGGGFGGKEDMSVQHHAALLAQRAERPVQVALSRQESILCHPKRHAMEMEFTSACDAQGRLTALKATIRADTGAFASLGGPVLQRACTHAAGPYHYTDIEIDGWAYYTNNPPAGAFRGFGVTQSCFAIESNLNLLAEKVGISPWEIRHRNAIRPGQTLPNGQVADASTALVQTLMAVKPYCDAHPKAGIACAIKNSGLGVGVRDVGRCRLAVENGQVAFYSSAACIGQGAATVAVQIICEVTGLLPAQVCYRAPDTASAPDSGNTTASRQTLFMGEATRRAALALKAALERETLVQLEGRAFVGEYEGVTDPMGADKAHPVSHVAYGYATHVVDLGADGRIARVLAAHDVGRAINPVNIEGQVEGGVTMSLGYALTEGYPLREGRPLARLGTLGLLRAPQTPPIETIIIEANDEDTACGAKGIGEICSIPTPAAVALAYALRDGVHRTSLPLQDTPYARGRK